MHISSEAELIEALVQMRMIKKYRTNQTFEKLMIFFLRKRGIKNRDRAACLLRFMSIKKVELPQCSRLLKALLRPDCLRAVLIAIKSGESSNLPKGFQTGCRILTERRKKVAVSKVQVEKQMPKVSSLEQIKRLVEDAALQLSKLKLSKTKDSSTCTLVVGRNSDVSFVLEIFE
jgi:hypothetical protein